MSKKNEKVAGKIQFICPNCDLDRTKEENPLRTHCPRCGFNPSFPNKIVTLFEDLLRELDSKQKSIDELKQKLQQLLKVFPDINNEKYKLPEGWIVQDILDSNVLFIEDVFEWKKKFKELLKEAKP